MRLRNYRERELLDLTPYTVDWIPRTTKLTNGSAMNRKSTNRVVNASPYASSLLEGHRDIGYDLKMALADIIDNSITAGASRIEIHAEVTADDPNIAIFDNGCGMSETELVDAMRLGSKNPLDERDPEDLGRFGLGLKSASFSQCRKLTVQTRQNGQNSCACWDLDKVMKHNSWKLELKGNTEKELYSDILIGDGTIVVWEKLDRLISGYESNTRKLVNHLNAELAEAERHIRIVFHRFMEGINPDITILLNGRELQPIDPFASNHPSCQKDPVEEIRHSGRVVSICCHTLPHHKKMSKAEWEEIGGPEGHVKSQGFYVYRENRLIIAGGWLGLTRQTELTKLCRVRVDIPNTMDSEWKIDVKKSSTQLPPLVRERLKKIVERFISTSKRTYRRKGQVLVDGVRFPIWNKIIEGDQIIFRPNLKHPLFEEFRLKLTDEQKLEFEQCLRLIGSNLPIETLYSELMGNAEAVVTDKMEESDVEKLVKSLVDALMSNGVKESNLSDSLKGHPRLRENWELTESIFKDYIQEVRK